MFNKMFGKKKGAQGEEDSAFTEIKSKISKMNLTEMRTYVKNNIKDFELSDIGLTEVMKKITAEDTKTKLHYIQDKDMDVKKKKAFDLVVLVSSSNRLTLDSVELIQKFMEVYKEMISTYDKDNKEIYHSRLKDALARSIHILEELAKFKNKMDVLAD